MVQAPGEKVESVRTYDLSARLQAGSGWLTEQHRLWLDGDANDWDDVTISKALAGWNDLDRTSRGLAIVLSFGSRRCAS